MKFEPIYYLSLEDPQLYAGERPSNTWTKFDFKDYFIDDFDSRSINMDKLAGVRQSFYREDKKAVVFDSDVLTIYPEYRGIANPYEIEIRLLKTGNPIPTIVSVDVIESNIPELVPDITFSTEFEQCNLIKNKIEYRFRDYFQNYPL